MWGCRDGIMRRIGLTKLIEDWGRYERKGIDQDFLGKIIYPLIKNNAIEHSEFGLKYGNEIKSFPSKRNNYEFVGEIYDENDIRNSEHWQIIKNL